MLLHNLSDKEVDKEGEEMTKYFCDVCGAELPEAAVVLQQESDKLCFQILIGTKDDAMEDGVDWDTAEFCHSCVVKAVKTFFAKNAIKKGRKK